MFGGEEVRAVPSVEDSESAGTLLCAPPSSEDHVMTDVMGKDDVLTDEMGKDTPLRLVLSVWGSEVWSGRVALLSAPAPVVSSVTPSSGYLAGGASVEGANPKPETRNPKPETRNPKP